MAKHLTESNIDGTVQNFIQNHIFEIVKGQMRFENVEILVESGSKEGIAHIINCLFIFVLL